jgi:hypothetical protein
MKRPLLKERGLFLYHEKFVTKGLLFYFSEIYT